MKLVIFTCSFLLLCILGTCNGYCLDQRIYVIKNSDILHIDVEAASIHQMGQLGIHGKMLKRGCFPINANYDVTYIRPIKPFEKFRVVSQIVTWDDKYWYKEHRFEVDGELRAFGMVRAVFVCKKVVTSMGEITAITGEQLIAPDVPEAVLKWENFLEAKKEQSLHIRE
jgi:acyl-CoA thioesterase FadM